MPWGWMGWVSPASWGTFSNLKGWILVWGAQSGALLPQSRYAAGANPWQHLRTPDAQTSVGWKESGLVLP